MRGAGRGGLRSAPARTTSGCKGARRATARAPVRQPSGPAHPLALPRSAPWCDGARARGRGSAFLHVPCSSLDLTRCAPRAILHLPQAVAAGLKPPVRASADGALVFTQSLTITGAGADETEVTMTRSTTVGPQFQSLILPVLFFVCCLGGTTARAGEEGGAASGYVQIRVSTLDPPVIAPGDDDQPTIGSRRGARQAGISATPQEPTSAGTAVMRPSESGPSWMPRIRVFVGRLGFLLLRMPS
jgi:hypothetical protein